MTTPAETPDVLATIATYKRVDVERRQSRVDDIQARAADADPPRGFLAALVDAEERFPRLIAEIKKASPSRGVIRQDFDPPALARAYAEGGAACLSVLTDGPSFGGEDGHLVAARAACALPVLRKDFLVDPWQVDEARALGADAILVIMAMVDDTLARALIDRAARWRMDVLVEVHTEAEMMRARDLDAKLLGINNRDLRSFAVDLAVFERLARLAPAGAILVAESGVFSAGDAQRMRRAGACAMLVGESLMRGDDVTAAVRSLLGREVAGRK